MKKLLLAALLGAAVAAGGLLGKAKLEDAALNKASYEASQSEPVCLAQRDGGEAYIILESDKEENIYRGIRVLVMFQMPFELPARQLNERPDLKKVDCRTGQ